jgi:hypothetical protein
MIKHRQQIWSTIIKQHGRKSQPPTTARPSAAAAMQQPGGGSTRRAATAATPGLRDQTFQQQQRFVFARLTMLMNCSRCCHTRQVDPPRAASST